MDINPPSAGAWTPPGSWTKCLIASATSFYVHQTSEKNSEKISNGSGAAID